MICIGLQGKNKMVLFSEMFYYLHGQKAILENLYVNIVKLSSVIMWAAGYIYG